MNEGTFFMGKISHKTAGRIWSAYREIEVAQKLLSDVESAIANGEPATPRDVFGRQPKAFEFGVPSGGNGHRLFDVRPEMALSVIRGHIAHKESELAEANESARIELAQP